MSTPVTTMRLPSSRPMARTAIRARRVAAACARLSAMRIGILGGTGPAGTALGARLASVGFEVVLGSRSKYRAMEVARRTARAVARPATSPSTRATTTAPRRSADVVVVATPWDGGHHRRRARAASSSGKVVISMANALARVGNEFQPLVPPRGSVAAHVQAARARLPGRRRVPPPAGQGARRPRPPDRVRRADLLRPPEATSAVAEIVGQIPACARSTPASCRTRRRSRRSPPCCCSSTSATRPGSR